MPINKKEFDNGKLHSKLEEEILSFLNERKDRAFTSQEVMEGLHYHAEFSTPEISKMSSFSIADFTTFIHQLVEKGKIRMKIVRGRMYIIAVEENSARCPKCGTEIPKPNKTWNMSGRPNKKGEKLQLHIGLFKCPKHGFFRTVLNKRKIPTHTSPSTQTKESKKGSAKKLGKKKTAKKKTEAWLLA
jgi:hypothetical protein